MELQYTGLVNKQGFIDILGGDGKLLPNFEGVTGQKEKIKVKRERGGRKRNRSKKRGTLIFSFPRALIAGKKKTTKKNREEFLAFLENLLSLGNINFI